MAVATVDHVVSRDEIVWAFGPDLEPVLEVEPGAVVRFETNDCFTGQITSEDDLVKAPVTRLFRVEDGWIHMNDHVRFPARPMVGVVGVATDGETLSNGLAGRHGGNLDNHLHAKGARIYFPVRQPGGMFAVGDMHASMGDGEICFTGVEIAGEVDVRFDVLKGKQATWPVT